MLNDRVVLVTGAGRGIGRGIAQAVMQKGGAVIVTDISMELAESTREVLGKEHDESKILAAAMDVTDDTTIETIIKSGVEKFGKVDGLVNNAAVMRDSGPLLNSDPEKRALEVEVNLNGLLKCSQAFVRQLIDKDIEGNIVNVASQGGIRAHITMGNYSATKAAVINLTQCQSAEWGQYGVNVNAVCPGGVHTEMLQQAAEAKTADNENRSATDLRETWISPQLGRKMKAIEVGYAVAFLLSPEAVLIRGQAISVSGGIEHEAFEDYL